MPVPTATSTGSVPSQNTAIVSDPYAALPVPADAATNAYSQPQGRSVVISPITSARLTGGRAIAARFARRRAPSRNLGGRAGAIRTPRARSRCVPPKRISVAPATAAATRDTPTIDPARSSALPRAPAIAPMAM